jgi:Flp pilus assembly protein TadB
MPPFGFGLYTAIRNNPALQWAIGIGAALIALLTWDKFRTERIKREARAKAEKRAEKQSKAILKEMEDQSNDRIKDAVEARERVPDDVSSTSGMSDAARSILFGTRSDSGGGGGH